MSEDTPVGAMRRASAIVVVLAMTVTLGGCAVGRQLVRGPAVDIAQAAADDVFRQIPDGTVAPRHVTEAQRRIAQEIADLRAAGSQGADDASRATSAMESDAAGAEALSVSCGIAMDVATGDLPDNAYDWFVYLSELASERDEAQELAGHAEAIAEMIVALSEGDAEEFELQLMTFSFEQLYC